MNMGHIVIDSKKCKACYLCINECPKSLLKISQELNTLGQKVTVFEDPNGDCIGCAMCANRCPDLAITEVYK